MFYIKSIKFSLNTGSSVQQNAYDIEMRRHGNNGVPVDNQFNWFTVRLDSNRRKEAGQVFQSKISGADRFEIFGKQHDAHFRVKCFNLDAHRVAFAAFVSHHVSVRFAIVEQVTTSGLIANSVANLTRQFGAVELDEIGRCHAYRYITGRTLNSPMNTPVSKQ